MSKEDFNNALNHIDYELIEEYVEEKERLQRRAAQKRSFIRLAPIAACFVLVITFAITLLPMFIGGRFNYDAENLPPINESGSTTQSTTGGGEGASPPNDEGIEEVIPPSTGGNVDVESGDGATGELPEYGGLDPWDPGVPESPSQKPGEFIFVFTFEHDGKNYVLNFISEDVESFRNEMNINNVPQETRGAFIGTVLVTNHFSGDVMNCPVYQYINDSASYEGTEDGILVELYEGYYFFVSNMDDIN